MDKYKKQLLASKNVSQCIAFMHTIGYTNLIGGDLMAKTANINVRIEPEVKANAEQLFANFGITVTDAINIFLHQSLMVGGLPFEMKQPRYNETTEKAIREARDIAGGKIQAKNYSSVKELMEDIE